MADTPLKRLSSAFGDGDRATHILAGAGGPLGVGVLNADDELPAELAGVQPVEERRASASDVEVAGGGRRKADADVLGAGTRALRQLRRRQG